MNTLNELGEILAEEFKKQLHGVVDRVQFIQGKQASVVTRKPTIMLVGEYVEAFTLEDGDLVCCVVRQDSQAWTQLFRCSLAEPKLIELAVEFMRVRFQAMSCVDE